MSELGDIESAVIGLIQAVQVNSVDLFAEVKGFSNTAPRDVVAGLRRELKPAAYVVYDGRVSSDPFGVPADPKLSVFAIVESLRGGDEPRAGSALQSGGFDVLGELFTALAGSTIVTDRQLAFVDEHLIAANDTSVIYEQRYSVLKLATTTAPIFGGSVICGNSSIVRVTVGVFEMATERFAFPGIDGEFQHALGVQGRPITWSGQLRAASDSALSTIETTIESLLADSQPADIVDGFGRTFTDCVLNRFVRKGPRSKHAIDSQALQDFELHFVEVTP
ncbi:MAG: hypothetical protein IID41_13990 [Planctomycetes bacterium]|nr:hypothetical protein [Planctomycetota bacterium]